MELNKKKEIVFIVYKAGWWGCFDSIYRDLSNDETNNCRVIPIPYYERFKENNTLDYGRLHYEADSLPKDLLVTDYKTYNLKEHHPDVIYIHNPYDDQNPFDYVDMDYHSANLKTHTDLLVYIPHMLYIDDVPELMKSSTVYDNVDIIMVANDDVKKSFIGIPKQKLQTACSPLVNYIEKLNISRPDIPNEWKSMLPNGRDFEGKRVVLYHVSFSDLLHYTERIIKKIQYVFDYMKTKKNIVFVWRPDSDIQGRLNELPEKVMNDYLRLRNYFIDDKIGIYDTTDDECIASILSDAYIGDTYPIMNLFGIQGKPIVIMDMELRFLPSDDELCSVKLFDYTADGADIWFVADEYNLLCKMNLNSGKMEVIDEIPDEVECGVINYCGIIKKNSQIYLNPYSADTFVTYDIDKSEFSKTYIPTPRDMNFDYMVSYKEYIFLITNCYPAIIRYNTITKEYKYYDGWIEQLEKYASEEDMKEPYFLWGIVEWNERLMIASSKANVVMEFNMENGDYRVYEVGLKGSKYWGMEYDGENFWLIPYMGKDITFWNYNTGDWKIYNDFASEIEDNAIPFRAILKYKQSLLVFPCMADFGLKIGLQEKKIKKNKLKLNYPENTYKSEFYTKTNTLYLFAKVLKEGIIIAETMYDSSILLIDLENDKVKKILCRIPLQRVKDHYDKLIGNYRDTEKYPCMLSENLTLRILIDYFAENNCLINSNEKRNYYSRIERYTKEK